MKRVLLTESGGKDSGAVRNAATFRASTPPHSKNNWNQGPANYSALTDPSVLVAVLVPLISLIIQVRHSHRHFWGGKESKGGREKVREDEREVALQGVKDT